MKFLLVSCVALLVLSSGCQSSTDPNAVAHVAVSPDSITLTVESIKQLAAVPSNEGGTVLSGRTIVWSTSDKTIATVSKDGLVKGVGAGTAVISATTDGRTGVAEIVVLPMIGSLTGVWTSSNAGPLSNLRMQITETNSETVTGQWSAYDATCTPLNSAECQRSGTIVSGYRHGSSIQFVIAPGTVCGVASATMTGMFLSSNQLSLAFTQHVCDAQDKVPTSITLSRQ